MADRLRPPCISHAESSTASFVVGLAMQAEGGVGFTAVGLFVELLAGDIGVLHDKSGPAVVAE